MIIHPWQFVVSPEEFREAERIYKIMSLNDAQEKHLQAIKDKVCEMIDVKYRAGAKEHGGCLGDLTEAELLRELRAELIDGLTYMAALELKMEGNK